MPDYKPIMLSEGCKITIRRTDGRIHTAKIAFIKPNTNYVNVEWHENGETKMKEILINQILELNPALLLPPNMQERYTNVSQSLIEDKPKMYATAGNHRYSASVHNSTINSARVLGRGTNDTISNLRDQSHSELHIAKNVGYTSRASKSVMETIPTFREPSTVQKITKLERDREQRRRLQAEIKAEKQWFIKRNYQNCPHWELNNMIKEFRSHIKFLTLSKNDDIEDHLITVAVRKRPLNESEFLKKEIDIITIPNRDQLIVHEPKLKVDLTKYLDNHTFRFDYALNEFASNDVVYKYTAQPLMKTVFDGGFATCFAYGQTGSGKTYTMSGNFEFGGEKGIYALTAADIFKLNKSQKYKHKNFIISCSFFEIYVKKVFDLLNKKNVLKILEDGKQQVQVVGLTEKIVQSESEVLDLIRQGNEERASGQTSANTHSSRSHAIFQFYLRSTHNYKRIHGKFSLVDLAGNERGADTYSSSKLTRLEGAEINQSLLSLKECIRALGRKGAHLPFRGSKLTQVLRDSFIGVSSKTCMIAMVSPGVNSCENTLNTLRYADRVKELGGGDVAIHKPNMETYEDIKRENDTIQVSNNMIETGRADGDNNEYMCRKINEKILNQHKEIIRKLQRSAKDAENLLNSSTKCETEQYYSELEFLIDNTVENLLKVKDLM